MVEFTPGREQDAAPTIRGFKYQVQLTLLRWLDLVDGDTLYLECGEDIDRVLRATDSVGVQRELEQVKARGRNVTLRSPEVLAALANFAAHIKANPGLSLRFRYTTTAFPGREALSPLGKGTKAIEFWRALQAKNRWTADDDVLVAHLIRLLCETTRPAKCPEQAWKALMDIAAGTGAVPFGTFVARFEWSCGSASPDDLESFLMDRLGQLPGDMGPGDPSRAQRYDQLISAVLDTLSREGEKKLTTQSLTIAFQRPTLTGHDRARLKLLEQQSASQAAALGSLQATMQRLGSSGPVPILFGQVAADLQSVSLSATLPELPPLVSTLARRTATVDGLSGKLGRSTWISLDGDYGRGKSHLGFLVAEKHGGIVLGVSMRGLSAASAEHGLMSLVGTPAMLAALDSGSPGLVLLDDLPDCEPQSRLEVILAAFAKAVLSTGRSIISTSRRALSANLTGMFGAALIPQATPPFSDSDVKELFRAHHVQEDVLTEQRITAMNAMCGGHPMLLTALARHLLTRPDKPDQALVEALLASTHRAQIDLETSRAVFGTIEVEACRGLLYRLASAATAMNLDEIRMVAGVAPALPEPTACIARLDGLWLRRTANARYELSPLATPLWREVPEGTHKAVHSQLARILFRRRRLTTSEFIKAITSLIVAGEHDSAAMYMLLGCMRWPNKAVGYADLGILLFFPPDRDHGLRPYTELPLRGAQAVTAAIEGSDPQPYVTRIETAIRNPTPEIATGALAAGSMILTSSLDIPMQLAVLGASLIERFHKHEHLPALLRAKGPGYPDGVHLLLSTACIRNWNDLDLFVGLLASLSEERRRKVVSIPELKYGMQVIVFRALFDAKLSLTDGAFERLGQIENRSYELGLTLLSAYAASGRLIVLGEYKKDLDRMLAEADRARKQYVADATATSVIEATVGQQLFLNKRAGDGLRHLIKGLADPTHIIGHERGNRLVDALSAAWEVEEDAGAYADELAAMLAGEEFTTPDLLCQMHIQVALVRWRQGRRTDAFVHFEGGAVRFFALNENTRTRQLGVGLAHALGYYTAVAETGKPPIAAADGGPYAEGGPRMFTGPNEGMAAMWRVRQGPAVLRWMLGRLADALGLDEAASSWTDRAQEAAVESKAPALLVMLAPRGVAGALRNAAWVEAIEAAVTHGRARVFVGDERYEGAKAIEDSVQFDPLEPPVDREQRQRAEEGSLWVLSRMLVSQLGWRVIAADQGREALNALGNAISGVAAQSQLTTSWQAMADVVHLVAAPTMTDQQHKDALAETAEPGSECARFVAHGLLALRSDARLSQAAVSHVGALHRLDVEAKALGVPLDNFAQAVSRYWTEALARAAFRFTAPRVLARAIEEAPTTSPVLQAKAILRAVLGSLSPPVAAESRAWLSAEDA